MLKIILDNFEINRYNCLQIWATENLNNYITLITVILLFFFPSSSSTHKHFRHQHRDKRYASIAPTESLQFWEDQLIYVVRISCLTAPTKSLAVVNEFWQLCNHSANKHNYQIIVFSSYNYWQGRSNKALQASTESFFDDCRYSSQQSHL